MYQSFYKLDVPPFQITSDPKFLWLGTKYREGLNALEYGLLDNAGVLVLTGDIGTGKTTLVNMLLQTLQNDTLVAVIRDPKFESIDFYNYLSHAFKLGKEITSKRDFFAFFEKFLQKSFEAHKKLLLIIDEAQRINHNLLEDICLLVRLKENSRKTLNVIFVGQLEFNDILQCAENRAMNQLIGVKYTIPRLNEFETGQYIKHRLIVAGAEEEIYTFVPVQENNKKQYIDHILVPPEGYTEIFTEKSIQQIYIYSRGYPRLINIICDRCLLTGFAKGSKTITAEIVKECKKKLKLQRAKSREEEVAMFLTVPKQKTKSLTEKIPAQDKSITDKDNLLQQETSQQKTFPFSRSYKPPSN